MYQAIRLWRALISGLWFVPTAIVLAAIGLAFALVELDRVYAADLARRAPRLFASSAEGARTMLSAIATSMITVAGVTFSITIVALSLASQQYSPRILRTFTADRPSQLVLGTFVGVFAYCLVVLRTVRGGEDEFAPSLAVAAAVLLALLGVGVLIFFIDHVSSLIQVSTLLDRIERDTTAAIERLFPEDIGRDEPERPGAERAPAGPWIEAAAPRSGYLQSLDDEGLLEIARRLDLVVRMERGIGEFVVEGSVLASVAGAGARDGSAAEAVLGAFAIGVQRTIDQDVGFGLQQIGDIALRALSPGINDTSTAIACIDRTASVLARLARRRFPGEQRYAGATLRVIARSRGFRELLDRALDPLRRAAEGNAAALGRLYDALGAIGGRASTPERRRAVERQVARVDEAVERTVAAAHDREMLAVQRERALRSIQPADEGAWG